MDIIHHTLIGGAGLSIAAELNQPLLGVAFIVGSISPDLDVIFMFFGKRFYLRNHQGITHSLILAPLFSIFLCLPLLWLLNLEWNWLIYLGMLAGLVIHITLDWFNTFRIALFYPFIKKRYSLDAMFFIDSVLLAFTAAFYLFYIYMDAKAMGYIYPVIFTVYCTSKLYLHKKVINQLNPLYAIPSSINPFEFYILEGNDDLLCGYLYSVISNKRHDKINFHPVDMKFQELAETSNVFREIKLITRALTVTEVLETDTKITIIASDLAVRNFGGEFAKTTLTFDNHGNLLNELANI
ncbi:MAG: metal-dependent hydrolase [Gammaproteobacteria bacterium]|nr:metal-dependent hydrolase [Gammaproteobacteria bacterium]